MYSIDILTVGEYFEKLAAPDFPSPASGSAAATVAATAAALLEMSCRVTTKKYKKDGNLEEHIKDIEAIRKDCLFLATEDMKVFGEVIKAGKTKKDFPDQYETAVKKATHTLILVVKNCNLILTHIEQVANNCYVKVLEDLVGCAYMAEAGAAVAKQGVEENLKLLENEEYKKNVLTFVHESYKNSSERKDKIVAVIAN